VEAGVVTAATLRAIDGGAVARDDCFDKSRFLAPVLSRALRAEAPVANGGELLHRYRDGAYRPDGERWARRRVAEILGNDSTRNRADEVVYDLRTNAPDLEERPSLDLVNCANGLLELSTGKVSPHTPDLLSPVQIAVAYEPRSTCPAIKRFLSDVIDAGTAETFFQLAGYLTVPDNRLQRAVMMLGSGNNGKSTATELLARLLGSANVEAIPLHRLDEDRFAVADLYGKLANIFADLDARALRSSSIFKSITGGDRLSAERKFRPSFTFTPYARLVFSANAVPPTSDSSEGFFRRWLVLPFDGTISHAKRDPMILAKLSTPSELSGLLNEGIARLGSLREHGDFSESTATTEAKASFRVHADSVAGFIEDACFVDPTATIVKSRLAAAYRHWCEANGRAPVATQRFNSRLADLVPVTEKAVKGQRLWTGIHLLETP
jgi:putative DNA primase/helicase